MSYGWLTQSALLPKKSKAIKVQDEGSLFSLKTILIKQKQKIAKGNDSKPMKTTKERQTVNPGIQQRMRKDQMAQSSSKQLHQSQKVLKKKEQIYKQLEQSKRNVGKLLVDFTEKSLLKEESDDFQKNKELFYSGKLQELQRQRIQIQTQQSGEHDARQRLTWEKQVLGQLRGQLEQKQKVKQVFDRKLDKEEKQALQKIKKEFNAQQRLIQQAKKRRQEIKAQRMYKLSKLNILNTSKQVTEIKFTQQKTGQNNEEKQ